MARQGAESGQKQATSTKVPAAAHLIVRPSTNLHAMLKKLWNDPVWSKVIAAVILAVAALLGTYFLNWWSTISRKVIDAYNFALSPTPLSNWGIGVLSLLATSTIIGLLARIWQKIFPPSSHWQNYITDTFFALRWRWRYFEDGQICDVHTYCPHCDFEVYEDVSSAYRTVDRVAFRCDRCGRNLGEFNESFASLGSKVKRLIEQRNRNGSRPVQPSA